MRTHTAENRDGALRVGWTILKDRLRKHGTSRSRLRAELADFDTKAIVADGRVIGIFMARGPEVHVAVLPEVSGLWLSRGLLRDNLAPIIKRYGYIETSVMPDNAQGLRFLQRLGFKRDGEKWRLEHAKLLGS